MELYFIFTFDCLKGMWTVESDSDIILESHLANVKLWQKFFYFSLNIKVLVLTGTDECSLTGGEADKHN